MKLITKEIAKKAQAQFKHGSSLSNQQVVAKFFTPAAGWTWYLMNQDPDDTDYLWGIVKGFELEMGSFSLSELESVKLPGGLGVERDKFFKPMLAEEVWRKLQKGEHI